MFGRLIQARTDWSVGGWEWGVGSVVCLESYLDRSFGYFEPFGHAVHGDAAGAGGC